MLIHLWCWLVLIFLQHSIFKNQTLVTTHLDSSQLYASAKITSHAVTIKWKKEKRQMKSINTGIHGPNSCHKCSKTWFVCHLYFSESELFWTYLSRCFFNNECHFCVNQLNFILYSSRQIIFLFTIKTIDLCAT